jgi:hypothetical protein
LTDAFDAVQNDACCSSVTPAGDPLMMGTEAIVPGSKICMSLCLGSVPHLGTAELNPPAKLSIKELSFSQ